FELNASRRILGDERTSLLRHCRRAVEFANSRAAHSNPAVLVHTRFRELDQAIDYIRTIVEKLILLLYDEPRDLFEEMRSRKLQPGWDEIFLESWATKETLSLSLGELDPPEH